MRLIRLIMRECRPAGHNPASRSFTELTCRAVWVVGYGAVSMAMETGYTLVSSLLAGGAADQRLGDPPNVNVIAMMRDRSLGGHGYCL